MKWLLVVSCLLAAGQVKAGHFFEEGKEFKYKTFIRQGAGTMDHAPHMSGMAIQADARVQQRGKEIFVELANPLMAQYVGPMGAFNQPDVPLDDIKFTPIDGPSSLQFSINTDGGTIRSVALPDVKPFFLNIIKAFASQFSVSDMAKAKKSFVSKEPTLMGKCDVEYTVTPDRILKSIDHNHGCEDMPMRKINNWRGWDCKGDEDHIDGIHSQQSSVLNLEKVSGGQFKITSVMTHGAVISQMFETEGVSHLVIANITSVLVGEGSSPGDISGGNVLANSVTYSFGDGDWTWDKNRDLKAAEPLLSAGWMGEGKNTPKTVNKLEKMADAIIKTYKFTGNADADIDNAHKHGIIMFIQHMSFLDYNGLVTLGKKMMGSKSEEGILKANMFTEAIGSVGTTAAAMLIKDFVVGKKFDNDRDAARALTAIPFHIRRPNVQLLEEIKPIMDMDHSRFVNMAAPLTFGHLVRITCERAGGNAKSAEAKKCFKTQGKKYVNYFFQKFQSATDRDEKLRYLSVIHNIRFGGVPEKLMDIITGKTDDTAEVRTHAMWAAFVEAIVRDKAMDLYMPIFANRAEPTEVRITAASIMMYSNPSAIDFTRMVNVLYKDTDYELTNFVFTLLEKYANSIDPCNTKKAEYAGYYLKYLKQFSQYETNWGFGVSKTYKREFFKKKYGYAGSTDFYTVGTEDSMTPLSVGMNIGSTLHHNYKGNLLGIHLRVEGLAKGLIRKFKTMDADTWKTADLEKILNGEMGIRAIPNQPIRVQVVIMLKGVIVIHRSYDETSIKAEGKIGSFMKKFQDLGDTYSINHLRMIMVGETLYEQPSVAGFPVFWQGLLATSGHIKATVKRGQHRGLIFRNIEYDIRLFSQGTNVMGIANTAAQKLMVIAQDRIYKANFPRKVVVGVNPLRKELKLSLSRPTIQDPVQLLMHSRTSVFLYPDTGLNEHCPSCKAKQIVSAGPDAVKERVFLDRESKRMGFKIMGKYFGCEMDIDRRNTIGKAVAAFMPYNKNPKTPWTGFTMGMRQIRAFFIFFPRAEQCGAMFQWSQSESNPVSEVEISVSVDSQSNGEKLFFRGRKTLVKAMIKGKAEHTRAIKIQLSMESTPNNVANKMKLQVSRAGISALGVKPYVACIAYQTKYPDMPADMIALDMSKELTMQGKMLIQHGYGKDCGGAGGEIRAKFEYSTTKEAKEEMKKKWYYKQCMEEKSKPEWASRPGKTLPPTLACIATASDAASARRYKYNFEFTKLMDRTKALLGKIRSAVEVGLLPYWDVDPEEIGADGEIGPFLKIDAKLHSDDKLADVTLETRHGTKTLTNYALKFPWGRRLRNLVFSTRVRTMMKVGVISPCLATKSTIRTMDNVTYPYEADSCWTLMSGHCGETPSYAVFAKKVPGKMPLAMKAFIGGHEIQMNVNTGTMTVNGSPITLGGEDYVHNQNNVEIFRARKMGSTYHIYSFLKVWISYGGDFINVIPAPSVKGVHCGMCGNYNRNRADEWTGKDGVTKHKSAAAMAADYKWKC